MYVSAKLAVSSQLKVPLAAHTGADGHMQTVSWVLDPLCVVPLSVSGATPPST